MKLLIVVLSLVIMMVTAQIKYDSKKVRNVYKNVSLKSAINAEKTIINPMIVGGEYSKRGQFPWQVALSEGGFFFCGASLISDQWILTAAHCVVNTDTFEVTLGAFDVTKKESGAVKFITTSKIVHADYDENSLVNDIALLKLDKPVIFSKLIRTIRLPKLSQANVTFDKKSTTISGWGLKKDNGKTSPKLRYVNLPVISNTECNKTYEGLSNSVMCTSGVHKKGTCNGDSGGPLVFKDTDRNETQIGIVSFGTESCVISNPSAYTRVASFLTWIYNQTKISARE